MDKKKQYSIYTKKEFELSGDELRVPHILYIYIYTQIPACIATRLNYENISILIRVEYFVIPSVVYFCSQQE